MSFKNKTQKELEAKIEEMERFIAKKGVGSDYLSKAEKVQRDLNLALIMGGIAAIAGVTAWTLLRSRNN